MQALDDLSKRRGHPNKHAGIDHALKVLRLGRKSCFVWKQAQLTNQTVIVVGVTGTVKTFLCEYSQLS
ncbi:MAG: hypothetical protein PHQ58_18520 [Rhodoferax sp.]|uniref:hypothetical protein n=1 Tax=Rhodoferax sp. TaxID=50421 RepID=UPI0026359D40|nr:hypothetical protein [Rhodoferax sp.]MDD2882426.1 hypothetical protein [Rhodoferax sp.]